MSEITVILERLNRGEQEAFDDLVPLVYEELRHRASRGGGASADHTLGPTALVHEAFVKLLSGQPITWQGSRHFYNAAAEVMRQIVLNHARASSAKKRGGGRVRVRLEDVEPPVATQDEMDYEALDAALTELRQMDQRRHEVVMLRYFAGLSDANIAQCLDVSEKTVERDWAAAKAFLRASIS